MGSGVPEILEFYSKGCFKFSEYFLLMTFPIDSEDNTLSGGQIDGVIQIAELTQRQEEVIKILVKDQKISRLAYTK